MTTEEIDFEDRTASFWRWFSSRCGTLSDSHAPAEILEELDQWVQALNPGLSWEIGPSDGNSHCLVISPNLDFSLRPVVRAVISRAPELPGWKFHFSRLPKKWNYTFFLDTVGGERTFMDASLWTFALLRFPDGEYELLLCRNRSSPDMSEADRWHASTMVLESILGEDKLMDLPFNYELLDELEPRFAITARSVSELAAAFAALDRE